MNSAHLEFASLTSDADGIQSRSTTVDQDRAALIALYHATGGNGWTNNLNWLSAEPLSTWYGVTVDSDGRVERLQLVQNRLIGEIPDEIGQLNRLEFLNLSLNELSGSIPTTIGNLTQLDTLGFSSNQLTGSIPSEIGRLDNLRVLGLVGNRLSGPIPVEIGHLGRLEHLILAENQLTGQVPDSIGDLARLAHLVLYSNKLTGNIPPAVGDLSQLQSLHINDNRLTGQMPTQLDKLTNLRRIYAAGNLFFGCLPRHLATIGEGDVRALGFSACPFGLPDLTVLTGTIDPAFNGLQRQYKLGVPINAGSVTLVPYQGSASVEYQTTDGAAIPDADMAAPGHQILVSGFETRFKLIASSRPQGELAEYQFTVLKGFAAEFKVVENLFVQAPGNEDLQHNILDLDVQFGGNIHRAGFLAHFRATGEVERWGYPTSEVMVLEPNTLTQFYQRGALDFHNLGAGWVVERRLAWDYVGGGLGGSQDQGVELDVLNPHAGTISGPWGHKISNFAIDGTEVGFADFYERLGGVSAFGFPKSDARADTSTAGTLHSPGATLGFTRQYFQAAILEFHPNDTVFPVKLTLLGDTLRGLLVEGWEDEPAFDRAEQLVKGAQYVPPLIEEG